MINIFKKECKTLTSDIDTWIVKWYRATGGIYVKEEEVAQFFSDKDEAEEFVNSLKRAVKLLGHTGIFGTEHITCQKVIHREISE